MSCVAFTVHGQPVPKARARVINGRAYTPAGTVKAELAIAAHARRAGVKPHDEPVHLVVRFYRFDARRCDLDNLVKTVGDALNGIAWNDDSQVVLLTAAKLVDRGNPRTEVEIHVPPSVTDDWSEGWELP